MKTKINALLEEFCGDDFPKIKEHANSIVSEREIPFVNAGLIVMDNFIEISENAKKEAKKIAVSKGISFGLSAPEPDKLMNHLKEGKQQVKIGKLP
ncbi:unnamed protein product, partial [marine sediment metagenome]